jgi:hypothetical protein
VDATSIRKVRGKMSLLDRLQAIEERVGKPNICPVKRVLDSMDAETAELLKRLLDGRASIRQIHLELKGAGFKIARESLTAHRNAWCACKENQ